MLVKKYPNVLLYNAIKSYNDLDKTERLEKVKFREFKKSEKTMQKIKEAGLENEIDDCIEVETNYKIKKVVGYGATSVVYKAYKAFSAAEAAHEKLNSDIVAIKNVKKIFHSDTYCHRVLRELRLLRILRGHKNIVKLKTIMRPRDSKNFDSINLVFEYCT